MNKTLQKLESAAGTAVSSETAKSVASLYRLKVNDGFELRRAKAGEQTGETNAPKDGKG